MIKNKLTNHLLKDFYLNNAISLGKRLYEAFPDEYLNTKQYINQVVLALSSKIGDTSFNRKMGLKMTSMLLGPHHQPLFDNLMERLDDNPILKEPFDRDTKQKMVENIKHLDGHEKLGGLHHLTKKQLDLVALYAKNKIAKPKREQKKQSKVEKKSSKKSKKNNSAAKNGTDKKPVDKKANQQSSGNGKAKIDKINKKDLKKIIQLAEVS